MKEMAEDTIRQHAHAERRHTGKFVKVKVERTRKNNQRTSTVLPPYNKQTQPPKRTRKCKTSSMDEPRVHSWLQRILEKSKEGSCRGAWNDRKPKPKEEIVAL